MKKANLFIFSLITLSLFSFAFASAQSCTDQSFIRDLIPRIQNSDLSQDDKDFLFQRIRNYLSEDNQDYLHLLRSIWIRVRDSDLTRYEKLQFLRRIQEATTCQ